VTQTCCLSSTRDFANNKQDWLAVCAAQAWAADNMCHMYPLNEGVSSAAVRQRRSMCGTADVLRVTCQQVLTASRLLLPLHPGGACRLHSSKCIMSAAWVQQCEHTAAAVAAQLENPSESHSQYVIMLQSKLRPSLCQVRLQMDAMLHPPCE
jgi:hypothetical protein